MSHKHPQGSREDAVSSRNVEIVGRALEEFIATHELSDLVARDFIWDMSTFRDWPSQGEFHGFDGFRKFFGEWIEAYDEWRLELEEVRDAGDREVVAVLRQRGRLRGGDSVLELRYGTVYTVEDGKIRRAQTYATPGEAFEAVGLTE